MIYLLALALALAARTAMHIGQQHGCYLSSQRQRSANAVPTQRQRSANAASTQRQRSVTAASPQRCGQAAALALACVVPWDAAAAEFPALSHAARAVEIMPTVQMRTAEINHSSCPHSVHNRTCSARMLPMAMHPPPPLTPANRTSSIGSFRISWPSALQCPATTKFLSSGRHHGSP